MSTYQKALADQEIWSLPGGSNFQILSSAINVDVDFFLSGRRVDEAVNVPASYFKRQPAVALPPGAVLFDQVKIKAAYGAVDVKVDISGNDSGTNILSGDVSISSSGKLETIAPVTVAGVAAQIVAAGNRKEIIIQSEPGSANAWLGSAGVSAVDGMLITANGVAIFTTSAAVYAITGGGNATFRLTEI